MSENSIEFLFDRFFIVIFIKLTLYKDRKILEKLSYEKLKIVLETQIFFETLIKVFVKRSI